jgi:heme/copper-type cytochrome/quinol oxidase subunit 1
VLYTFYPPMIGSPIYYLGVVLVVVGSWIWVALMSINLRAWRGRTRARPCRWRCTATSPGLPVGLTSVGAAVEVLVLILPASLGLVDTINAGLARVLFSWTLHAIVYFWLMPRTSPSTRCSARHRRASLQRHDGARSRSPSSSSSRCRSASTTCSPTRRSAPVSSSCTRR